MEMNSNYNNNMMNPQQRDIVLSPNEYVFVHNNTNGSIKTYTGPITITISAQDSLVVFDNKGHNTYVKMRHPRFAESIIERRIPRHNYILM